MSIFIYYNGVFFVLVAVLNTTACRMMYSPSKTNKAHQAFLHFFQKHSGDFRILGPYHQSLFSDAYVRYVQHSSPQYHIHTKVHFKYGTPQCVPRAHPTPHPNPQHIPQTNHQFPRALHESGISSTGDDRSER